MIVVAVVKVVRSSPWPVRNHKRSVADMATEIIQPTVIAERCMAAVMTDNKQAPHEKPGEVPVNEEPSPTESLKIVVEIDAQTDSQKVPEHVEQRSWQTLHKTVGGDCGPQLLHGRKLGGLDQLLCADHIVGDLYCLAHYEWIVLL